MSDRQTTLAAPFTVASVGLHTGRMCRATVRPAPADAGIAFLRDGARIRAAVECVADTRRCTCLRAGDVSVSTVEHVLSALAGCGVDNAEIVVDGPELPILDGSAAEWVAAIRTVGRRTLGAAPRVRQPDHAVAVNRGESWLVAVPDREFRVTVATDYAHPMLGPQAEEVAVTPEAYAEQIAPARTFGFIEEVEALLQSGLALGGALDNALIVYPDRFSDALRVPNECLRHKMLDLIGDLTLAGGRIRAHIIAVKPGHLANVALAAALVEHS